MHAYIAITTLLPIIFWDVMVTCDLCTILTICFLTYTDSYYYTCIPDIYRHRLYITLLGLYDLGSELAEEYLEHSSIPCWVALGGLIQLIRN